jgi:hypothetical protein
MMNEEIRDLDHRNVAVVLIYVSHATFSAQHVPNAEANGRRINGGQYRKITQGLICALMIQRAVTIYAAAGTTAQVGKPVKMKSRIETHATFYPHVMIEHLSWSADSLFEHGVKAKSAFANFVCVVHPLCHDPLDEAPACVLDHHQPETSSWFCLFVASIAHPAPARCKPL